MLWYEVARCGAFTTARCGVAETQPEATAGALLALSAGRSSGRSSGVAIANPAARAAFASLSAPLDQFLAIARTFRTPPINYTIDFSSVNCTSITPNDA
jgi:hypothetical protein